MANSHFWGAEFDAKHLTAVTLPHSSENVFPYAVSLGYTTSRGEQGLGEGVVKGYIANVGGVNDGFHGRGIAETQE